MAKEPKLGNIRTPDGTIVMYRDWITKEPVPIVEGWALVSDNACENNPLVINEDVPDAVVDGDNNEFVFDGDL